MSVLLELVGSSLQSHKERGCCELRASNLSMLRTNQFVETNQFELGGFQWRVAALRRKRNSGHLEMLKFMLFSCNDKAIKADVGFALFEREQCRKRNIKRNSRTACPYHYIDKVEVPLSSSENSLGQANELIVKVDLMNIREATLDQQRGSADNMSTIALEEITDETIRTHLSHGRVSGIVPKTRKRDSQIYSNSYVRLWARRSPDVRYWLAKRYVNGTIVICDCLDGVGLLQTFDNIAEDFVEGSTWLTVLKEEKKSGGIFPAVEEDTIVVFCKLHDDNFDDPSYLGHVVVSAATKCYYLPEILSQELDGCRDWDGYRICLENGKPQRDLSCLALTLQECGVHSGSVLLSTSCPEEKDAGTGESAGQYVLGSRDGGQGNEDLESSEKEGEAKTGSRGTDDLSAETGDSFLQHRLPPTSQSITSLSTACRTSKPHNTEDASVSNHCGAGDGGRKVNGRAAQVEQHRSIGFVKRCIEAFEGMGKQPSGHRSLTSPTRQRASLFSPHPSQ